MKCRSCGSGHLQIFFDLGESPPSNSLVPKSKLDLEEAWYPLRTLVCEDCFLVQTEDFISPNELFTSDYVYFSSYSSTWLEHSKQFVEQAVENLDLKHDSFVVEIASNDGYLLEFVSAKGIRCLGIEPTLETASVAREKGLDILNAFFTYDFSQDIKRNYGRADLIVANNVLAHVPDPADMLRGIYTLLTDAGVATVEFHSLKKLITQMAIDTIYHEHFSYYSLTSFKALAESVSLQVVDVEELSTHGGSLRVHLKRPHDGTLISNNVGRVLANEKEMGLQDISTYRCFASKVIGMRKVCRDFLDDAQCSGFKIAGYGAAAKASTLLNYFGIKDNLVSMIADKNPKKIGKYLPGSLIPIVDLDQLIQFQPDYVIIFPWNIKDEIIFELTEKLSKKAKFFQLVPEVIELK